MAFDFLNSIERTATLRRNERADFENQFLSGFRVPAEANKLRLQSKTNRLNEKILDATQDDIYNTGINQSKSGLISSEIDLKKNQRGLSYENQFGEQETSLDGLKLQNDIDNEQQRSFELQTSRSLQEQERELQKLKIEDEISQRKSSIRESESKIESRLFDEQFDNLIKFSEQAQFESTGQKFQFLYRSLEDQGMSPSVKKRLDTTYLDASKYQLDTIGAFNESMLTVKGATETSEATRQTNLSRMMFELDKLDPEFLKIGLSQGVIKPYDIGPIITTVLENTNSEEFYTVTKGITSASKTDPELVLRVLQSPFADDIINQMKTGLTFQQAGLSLVEEQVPGEDTNVVESDVPDGGEEIIIDNDSVPQTEEPAVLDEPQPIAIDNASSLNDIPEVVDQSLEDEINLTTVDNVGDIGSISDEISASDALQLFEDDEINTDQVETVDQTEELDLSKPLGRDKLEAFLEVEPTLDQNYSDRLFESLSFVEVNSEQFNDIVDRFEQLEDLESNQ